MSRDHPTRRAGLKGWIVAVGVCGAFAMLEGLSSPTASSALSEMVQPDWALPFAGWIVVGVAFYAISVWTLRQHLVHRTPWRGVAIALVVVMLASNAGWNMLLLEWRWFGPAFFALFPYVAVVKAIVFLTWPVDRVAALLLSGYALFLLYDIAWAYALWSLNS